MKLISSLTIVALLTALPATAATASPTMLGVGSPAPTFTYRQTNGKMLRPGGLRGHPYVLWLVATWCSSCATGSSVVGDHIGMLARKGIDVVELRLSDDLGAPGPGLGAFQRAVGSKAAAHNWFWAEASKAQTLALDPKGYADLYYLVDRTGRIVAVDGNPAASWNTIQKFADGERTK
ncbi:MAG: hypothetical protein NVSMB31_05630 [Vulcanimicrobiaceae bacterium]